MKSSSCFLKVLALNGLVFFSSVAVAEDNGCQFDFTDRALKVASCSVGDGVEVIRLTPVDQASDEADLSNLPTFIIRGKESKAVLKAMVINSLSPYDGFIKLPSPSAILHFDDASKAVKLKLSKMGWELVDAKDVVYERADGSEGAGVVCSTLAKKIGLEFVAVAQCNGFYEADISNLKRLLGFIEGQSNR